MMRYVAWIATTGLMLCLSILATTPLEGQTRFGEVNYEYQLTDVLPGATDFVRVGRYWQGTVSDDSDDDDSDDSGESRIVGYVFLSDDLVDVPGYSGHTMNTLIGLDTEGTITGIRIVQHAEPIVLIGLPEERIHTFTRQYEGLAITDRVLIGNRPRDGYTVIDGISGATVTAVAENATVIEAARLVAMDVGIVPASAIRDRRPSPEFRPMGWDELVRAGAIVRFSLEPSDLEGSSEPLSMELYYAVLDPPSVGRNVLGERYYNLVKARMAEQGGSALFIASTGISFKGPGFARGGIFDRFVLEQEGGLHVFKDIDYLHIAGPAADGAPALPESGVFFIDDSFDPAAPFTLQLTVPYRRGDARAYSTFTADYELPRLFVDSDEPFWLTRWRQMAPATVLLAFLLGGTMVLFFFRRRLLRWREPLHIAVGLVAAIGIGGWLKAQPSTTQILTLAGSTSRLDFPSSVFLSEPLIFIFWIVIVVTLVIWGRGFFCGWVCPYGAFLELLYKLWHKIAPRRVFDYFESLQAPLRLRWLKVAVFLVILAVSFVSLPAAEAMDEIEPFKTFVLHLLRPPMFVAYFLIVSLVSVLNYRFFCRFMCPLGGALAIPSKRPLSPLLRFDVCSECNICAKGCEPKAISFETGVIDYRECLQCWDCQETAFDHDRCTAQLLADKGKRPLKVIIGSGLCALFMLSPGAVRAAEWTVAPGESISETISKAADGDTVTVLSGVYRENPLVDRRLVLRAEGEVVLDGGGAGHVVSITAAEARLEGFAIKGCGLERSLSMAGVWVGEDASGAQVVGNSIVGCRFGVWLHGPVGAVVQDNVIEGIAELAQEDRGDCIHLWSSDESLIQGNRVMDCRDGIYQELSHDGEVSGNHVSDSRYAIHTMWCDRSLYSSNFVTENLVGMALMFSSRISAIDNTLHANRAHGLLMVQVTHGKAIGNRAVGNTKGLFLYNSLYNEVRGNLLARNHLGLHYWGGSEDNQILQNAFIENQIQVEFVAARDQQWDGNYWSDYDGWDVDADGIGEVPYRSNTLVDALLFKYPAAKLLLTSPAFQVLALAERELPVIRVPKAVDARPLMEPAMKDWAETLAQLPSEPLRYFGDLQKLPHMPGSSS